MSRLETLQIELADQQLRADFVHNPVFAGIRKEMLNEIGRLDRVKQNGGKPIKPEELNTINEAIVGVKVRQEFLDSFSQCVEKATYLTKEIQEETKRMKEDV